MNRASHSKKGFWERFGEWLSPKLKPLQELAIQNIYLTLIIMGLAGAGIMYYAEANYGGGEFLYNFLSKTGAVIAGAAVIGFVLETLGFRRFMERIMVEASIDPSKIRLLGLSQGHVKSRIRALIGALHPDITLSDKFYKAFEVDILDRLISPFRKNFTIDQELASVGDGTVWLKNTTSYDVINNRGKAVTLFGESQIVTSHFSDLPSTLPRDWPDDELCKFTYLEIANIPQVPGPLQRGGYEFSSVKSPGKQFSKHREERHFEVLHNYELPPYGSTHVVYHREARNQISDYDFITMIRVTEELSVSLKYNPKEFEASLFALVPPHWQLDAATQVAEGEQRLHIDRCLLPGYTVFTIWRPISVPNHTELPGVHRA